MRGWWLIAAGLAGCTIGGSLTDEDRWKAEDAATDGSSPTSTSSTIGVQLCPAEGLTQECLAITGAEPQLTASSAGDGRIDLVHSGLVYPDCTTFAAEAHLDGTTITVTYDIVSPDTACGECAFTLSYFLSDVPSGTYTIVALDDEAEVTVP